MTGFSGSDSASKAIGLQGKARELFMFIIAGRKHRLGRMNSDVCVDVRAYQIGGRLIEGGAAEQITRQKLWLAGDDDVPCLGLSQNPPWLLPAPWETPESQSALETCMRYRRVITHCKTAKHVLVDDVVSTVLLYRSFSCVGDQCERSSPY